MKCITLYRTTITYHSVETISLKTFKNNKFDNENNEDL